MEILLDKVYTLYEGDAKTNIPVPFPVKKDFEAIELFCSYGPKECPDMELAKRLINEGIDTWIPAGYREFYSPWEQFLPVVNLVTLSLDYNGRYLGCAHRHAPEQRHIISGTYSSPGFVRQKASEGDWRALINVHAVVCGGLRYHLKITAHDRSTGEHGIQMF
jgi:hypothetical protein